MKILHVINSLEIGGAQRLLSDLIPIQILQGNQVSVAVTSYVDNIFSRRISDAGGKILDIGTISIRNPFRLLKLRKIIKDYDIIHVHLFPSLYFVAIASLGLNVRLCYTEHSTSNRRRNKPILRPLEQLVYKRYNRIISISEQTQSALQKWLRRSGERFVVIYNGVDINKFSHSEKTTDRKSLIMVSRFVAAKDQETVIKSLKYVDKDVILNLVGDGENLSHCVEVAEKEGVADRVNFLGARSDVADLVSKSYIGIQSSNWEGFGLTAVEMMVACKPVIASDVDGLRQVVDGAGLIFKKGDAVDLAAKIKSLLDDKDLYKSVAEKCRRRAKEYDISIMAEKYIQTYNVLKR